MTWVDIREAARLPGAPRTPLPRIHRMELSPAGLDDDGTKLRPRNVLRTKAGLSVEPSG